MSQNYQYPISSFSNGANLDKLTISITEQSSITKTIEEISNVNNVVTFTFDLALSPAEETDLNNIVSSHDGNPPEYQLTDIRYYLNTSAIVTDPITFISGPFEVMQNLINRRELFNDTDSPIYISNFTPLVGANGSVTNLNNIHAKHGWHEQEIAQAKYTRPKDILVYYGWMNSFNSSTNGWYNEKVAQDMAKYKLIVLGDGIQDPTHGDYANTQIIISRIKGLSTCSKIFGYVSVNQSYENFQTKVGQWNTLGVHGIMMDESGYDYGTTTTNSREAFNQKVDYIHGQTSSNICFANAWNTDHILGTADDASYPNSTWNTSALESTLNENDWIMLESFPVDTSAFAGNAGYEGKTDWATRGAKVISLRSTYKCNFAAINIINNDNANGQDLFDFAFVSAMVWSLEGVGTSDTSYGSSSAAVQYWTRPDVSNMGLIYTINPTIALDTLDADVYHRYCECSKLKLDFSTAAQDSSITKF